MIDTSFLIYFPDPYAVGNSRYFVGDHAGIRHLEVAQLETAGPLISFDVPTLVDDLRNNQILLPRDVTDICDAIRLNTGISRADGGEKRWSFWRHIKKHFHNPGDWTLLYELHTLRAVPPEEEKLESLALKTLEALSSLWAEVTATLERLEEASRFFKFEKPVAQIFYNRQHAGIRVDKDKLSTFSKNASNEKYTQYQLISDTLNISATGLTYWNIASRLKSTDLGVVDDGVTGYALRDRMKMASGRSNFALNFTKFLDAARDLDVLSRLADGG